LSIINKYVGIPTYSDYVEMMEKEALDFVIISTPTDSHTAVIRAAIEQDIHIFTEKPFSLTASEGEETLSILKGKSLVNQVGYVNRFNEVFMEVKELLNQGVIGDIKNIRSEMYSATVLKDSKSNWRSKKKTGGGCMYEMASHCIDLVVYLLGKPEQIVGSVLQGIYSADVEDLVSSTFLYKNGCIGSINANWSDESYRKPANFITILGTQGKIIADKHSYKVFLKNNNQSNGFHKGWNTRYITDFAKSVRFYVRGNEFSRQLDYFVECIQQERNDNISSFEEALKTDVIMEVITKDAAQSLPSDDTRFHTSPILPKIKERSIMWRRILK